MFQSYNITGVQCSLHTDFYGDIISTNLVEREGTAVSAVKRVRTQFRYDHLEGCLRWGEREKNIKWMSENGGWRSTRLHKPGVNPGDIAGTRAFGSYTVQREGVKSCGLRMIWQYVTGHSAIMRRVSTLRPDETCFRIGNLYLLPSDESRVSRRRAQNRTVVSWSYEHSHFTVLSVDECYFSTIMSYHKSIESAERAVLYPEVSFL
jgi:hypothetical protein